MGPERMTADFFDVKIDDLTDAQCRELLKRIEILVSEMPSFIEYNRDGGYGRSYDYYACCTGNTKEGHDKDCSTWQLRLIFGY